MSATVVGRFTWQGQVDDDGHRTWFVANKIRCSSPLDGPRSVSQAPGLASTGSVYSFGNDSDSFAYCYPRQNIQMAQQKEGDNTLLWIVTQTFSTKPLSRCNTTTIGNPLMEPIKLGGSFIKYTEESTNDMFGNPLLSSSWERFTGKQVEFDANRPTVWVEQNFSNNYLSTFAPLIDCVNNNTLWGLPSRCIKLDNATWERKLFGVCSYFYTVRLEFTINYNTFDRYIQDEGTKVLNGHWGSVSGSGCTLNITVSGSANGNSKNPVTGAAINAAGANYPASQNVTLALTGGTGTGASVTVGTDGSGAATSVVAISNGGQGYTTASGISTTGSIWVLDKINGVTPSLSNPQHFIRYKDLNGECGRVILDGRGQPAVGTRPGVFLVQKYIAVDLTVLGIPSVL